jgi:hypothetical protein
LARCDRKLPHQSGPRGRLSLPASRATPSPRCAQPYPSRRVLVGHSPFNEGHRLHFRVARVALGAGYNPGEGNRRASRNETRELISIPSLPIRNFSHEGLIPFHSATRDRWSRGRRIGRFSSTVRNIVLSFVEVSVKMASRSTTKKTDWVWLWMSGGARFQLGMSLRGHPISCFAAQSFRGHCTRRRVETDRSAVAVQPTTASFSTAYSGAASTVASAAIPSSQSFASAAQSSTFS